MALYRRDTVFYQARVIFAAAARFGARIFRYALKLFTAWLFKVDFTANSFGGNTTCGLYGYSIVQTRIDDRVRI